MCKNVEATNTLTANGFFCGCWVKPPFRCRTPPCAIPPPLPTTPIITLLYIWVFDPLVVVDELNRAPPPVLPNSVVVQPFKCWWGWWFCRACCCCWIMSWCCIGWTAWNGLPTGVALNGLMPGGDWCSDVEDDDDDGEPFDDWDGNISLSLTSRNCSSRSLSAAYRSTSEAELMDELELNVLAEFNDVLVELRDIGRPAKILRD